MSTLLIVGSANADHVMEFERLPQAGETLMSHDYRLEHGGKGANQAVACARLTRTETRVHFICALGDDAAAQSMRSAWQQDGMRLEGLRAFPGERTGSAMIFVSDAGENCIGVAPGANACLSPAMLTEQSGVFSDASYLLIQLETPLGSVKTALALARQHRCKTLVNPAPAAALDDETLALVDIITPNETEAQALTGIEVTDEASAAKAANILHGRGVAVVVITLGSRGAYLSDEGEGHLIPAHRVKPVDTVAAGDTFNGALMVGLDEGMTLQAAVDFANRAAAIAVTRPGAQRGIPYRQEIEPTG